MSIDRKSTTDRPADPLYSTVKLGQGAGSDLLAVEQLHIVVIAGPSTLTQVPCGSGPVRIGSAADNELVLSDPAVSRHHAIVEPVGGRLVLRDLGSTNGTFVSDVQIHEAVIPPGSSFRVGTTVLQVAFGSQRDGLPPSPRPSFGSLVGASVKMRQLFTLLERVAPTTATVLITGPTGTGKELVARSIHEASPRNRKPFVVLDCGATDAGLVSSEIFGHEPGAFTGATSRRVGVFEQARGGTVFIDELGELPMELQPKLLRVLESGELCRLGGSSVVPVDVRVVAATNRRIEQMVPAGRFREDLYYRLCQVKVKLPALDERRDDISLLVDTFLGRLPAEVKARELSPEARAHLLSCPYPGNVRQLKNLVERAAQIAAGDRIELSDLLALGEHATPAAAAAAPGGRGPQARTGGSPGQPGPEEKERLLAALQANDFNLMRTARALDIALNTLKSRMQRCGIPRPGAHGDGPGRADGDR